MRVVLPVDIGSFESPGRATSLSDCLNLMPYAPQSPGSATTGSLVSTPGVILGDDNGKVSHYPFIFKGNTYSVAREGIYLGSTLVASATESIVQQSSQAHVTIADNSEVVCICNLGGDSFFWDTSGSTITKITDSVFQDYQSSENGVRTVDSIDGYFIFNTTEVAFKSGLVTDADKGTSFDALDFSSAEFSSDRIVMVRKLKGELHVFGEFTTEVWANVGGTGFPFQRIDGATIEKGLSTIQSIGSVQEVDNSFIFQGRSETESLGVWRATGGGGTTKLSNGYIDSLMAQTDDGKLSFAYSQNGQVFYGMLTQNGTVFIDLQASSMKGYPVWHMRGGIDSENEDGSTNYSNYKYNSIIFSSGALLADYRYEMRDDNWGEVYDSGTPYLQPPFSDSVVDTTSVPIRRFTGPYLQGEGDDVYVSRVELRMKNAVGDSSSSSEADRNPTVNMKVSDDQGRTWKDFGDRAIGKSGKTRTQSVWNRGCGRSPNYRLFRFTTENSVEMVFLDIVLDIERSQGR